MRFWWAPEVVGGCKFDRKKDLGVPEKKLGGPRGEKTSNRPSDRPRIRRGVSAICLFVRPSFGRAASGGNPDLPFNVLVELELVINWHLAFKRTDGRMDGRTDDIILTTLRQLFHLINAVASGLRRNDVVKFTFDLFLAPQF